MVEVRGRGQAASGTLATSVWQGMGTQAGDVLVVIASVQGGGYAGNPPGWSKLVVRQTGAGTTTQTLVMFAQIATSTSPSISMGSNTTAALAWCVKDHGAASVSDLVYASASSSTTPSVSGELSVPYLAIAGGSDYSGNSSVGIPPGAENGRQLSAGSSLRGSAVGGAERSFAGPDSLSFGSFSGADSTCVILVPGVASSVNLIRSGELTVEGVYVGADSVDRVYVGDTLIYEN